MTRVASIDIGTNTIRLLIADTNETKKLKRILSKRNITRLGEGFIKKRKISGKAIQRSIKVLKEYLNLVNEYSAKKTLAVATSAVREAVNKNEFLMEIYRNTGLEIQVVSEKEEAGMTLTGVLSIINEVIGRALVIDIGGGSTEFIIIEGKIPVTTHSLDLGAVYLTERFIHTDPPTSLELQNLREFIDKRLSSLPWVGFSFSSLLGTAGTITTLAAIDQEMSAYDPEKINKYSLTREAVKSIYNRLKSLNRVERCSTPGLERGREDIILAGTIVLLSIMETLNSNEITVSDFGLLEGIIMDSYGKIENLF
ncbi:MAG: Ppx/GppA family phosphatase [Desulfobacterales bacterium]|nr:Ppx/GppA family phosphatase [Desulfobacterales bacterium]